MTRFKFSILVGSTVSFSLYDKVYCCWIRYLGSVFVNCFFHQTYDHIVFLQLLQQARVRVSAYYSELSFYLKLSHPNTCRLQFLEAPDSQSQSTKESLRPFTILLPLILSCYFFNNLGLRHMELVEVVQSTPLWAHVSSRVGPILPAMA